MKLILKSAAILILAWLLAGAPIATIRIKPMEANPNAPLFDPEAIREEQQEAQENLESGNYTPDADLQEMRSRIEESFSSLEGDPCNDEIRKEFSKALAPYLKQKKKAFDRDENVAAEERILDQETIGIITAAIEGGYIGKSDLPWAFKDMAQQPRATVCHRDVPDGQESRKAMERPDDEPSESYDEEGEEDGEEE